MVPCDNPHLRSLQRRHRLRSSLSGDFEGAALDVERAGWQHLRAQWISDREQDSRIITQKVPPHALTLTQRILLLR